MMHRKPHQHPTPHLGSKWFVHHIKLPNILRDGDENQERSSRLQNILLQTSSQIGGCPLKEFRWLATYFMLLTSYEQQPWNTYQQPTLDTSYISQNRNLSCATKLVQTNKHSQWRIFPNSSFHLPPHLRMSQFPEEPLNLTSSEGFGYFPSYPGQKLNEGRYEIIRKVGYGPRSSAWLALASQYVIRLSESDNLFYCIFSGMTSNILLSRY